jgi:hypothetical protein
MLRIEDTVGADSSLDRTLALRDAGVYSGKSGHFDDAVRQFSKAHEAIRSDDTYKPLAAALLVEKALGLWRKGSKPDAMVIAGQALDAVNKFLPSTSRQAERSHQYARGIVGLMFKEAGASEEPFDPPFTFGGASSLESESAILMEVELKSLPDNWRVLAAAEATSGINIGIDALSMSRQEGTLNCGVETGVRLGRYGAALKSGDANAVLKAARELAILATETALRKEDDGQPNQRIRIEEMARLLGQPLSGSDAEITMGENTVVDVILAATLADKLDAHFLDDLRKSAASIFGNMSSIEAIIKAASGNYAIGPSAPRNIMLVGGIATKEEKVGDDPGLRLYRDVTTLHHLLMSFGKDVLLSSAIRRIIDGWKNVWDHQRFRLRQSGLHEKAITDALEEALKTQSLAATGRLVTEMSAVTNHQLADGWFTALSTSA